MTVGDPVRIVAPTIVRFVYQHIWTNNRKVNCIMDISLDELVVSRAEAVNDLAGLVNQPWQDKILPLMTNNITFQGSSYLDLDSTEGVSGFTAPHSGSATNGTVTEASLTPQVSMLVRKNTAAHRGERQGRMYLPAVGESSYDENGNIFGPTATYANEQLEQYRTAIVGLSTALGVVTVAPRVVHVHKHDSDDPADWDWSSSDVTSFTVDNVCGTQRRRLRG